MALPASDTFANLSNWTTLSGSPWVSSNRYTGNGTTSSSMAMSYWTPDTPNDAQYSECAFDSAGNTNAYGGPMVRCATGAASGYGFQSGSNGAADIVKYSSGTRTSLASASMGTLSNGDVLRIEANGSTITAKLNGSTSGCPAAQTDSTYTSGRLGISARYYYQISGYHIYLKTWAGGNLSTTYTQNVSGAISSAGALKRTATKALAGAVTSAGALAKGIQYSLSLIGGMNPSGALTTLKAFGRVFAGTVTSSGAVTRSTTKGLGGAVSSAGALKRTATKTLVGAATSSGAAALTTTKALAGAVTSAGALTLGRLYARAFSGAISSAGALASVRQVYAGIPPATRTAVVAAVGRIALVAAGVRTWVVERGERTDKVEQ